MWQNVEPLTRFWEKKWEHLVGFKWLKPLLPMVFQKSMNIMAWFILWVTSRGTASNAGPFGFPPVHSVLITLSSRDLHDCPSMFPPWPAPQFTGLVQHCTSITITVFSDYIEGLKTHIFLGHLWRFSLCSLYYIWWGIVVTRGEMAYFWVHYETPMCSHSFSDSRGSIVNAFSFNP